MKPEEVVWLQAGKVRLGVVPRLGGRVMSMQFSGYEYLWRNPALVGPDLQPLVDPRPAPVELGDWQNWGGEKTWPAPQGWSGPGEWPGPPDAVLDGGAYRVLERSPSRVVLVSQYDARTGLRIRREIAVGSDESVSVVATLMNESPRRVRWAAWGVAQLAFAPHDVGNTSSGVQIEVAGGSDPLVLFSPLGTIGHARGDASTDPEANPSQGQSAVVRVPFADVVGKIGFPDATGRVRFRRSGRPDLLLDFAVDPEGSYPDGCRFELWMQTDHPGTLPGLDGFEATARLVELEPLSPVTDVYPGGSVTLATRWVWAPSADH